MYIVFYGKVKSTLNFCWKTYWMKLVRDSFNARCTKHFLQQLFCRSYDCRKIKVNISYLDQIKERTGVVSYVAGT